MTQLNERMMTQLTECMMTQLNERVMTFVIELNVKVAVLAKNDNLTAAFVKKLINALKTVRLWC